MGIFDWKGHDVHLHQVMLPMWHSTAIATRLVPRILELETKVGLHFLQSGLWTKGNVP